MRSSGGLRSGSTSTESLPAAAGFSSAEEMPPLSLGGRLEMAASHANFADAVTALSSWASMQQVCTYVWLCTCACVCMYECMCVFAYRIRLWLHACRCTHICSSLCRPFSSSNTFFIPSFHLYSYFLNLLPSHRTYSSSLIILLPNFLVLFLILILFLFLLISYHTFSIFLITPLPRRLFFITFLFPFSSSFLLDGWCDRRRSKYLLSIFLTRNINKTVSNRS